jgi:hypothetical protein
VVYISKVREMRGVSIGRNITQRLLTMFAVNTKEKKIMLMGFEAKFLYRFHPQVHQQADAPERQI